MILAHHALSNEAGLVLGELYRALVLGAGAFTLGLGVYILWGYTRQHLWPQRPYSVRRHVLAIITSYLLVLGVLEVEILRRALDRAPVTWRLLVGTIAFPLGAYALLTLLQGRARDPHAGRRSGDEDDGGEET